MFVPTAVVELSASHPGIAFLLCLYI